MTDRRPAFYASSGRRIGDLITLLHIPYTLWHLSYVAIGAALAREVEALRLGGTLAAFAIGLGVGAHALDELHGRPLATRLSSPLLQLLGWGSLLLTGVIALAGAFVISPLTLLLWVMGAGFAAVYALELVGFVHSDLGFAVGWGAFPVLVGYWAQTESISVAAMVTAAAAAAFSLAQRELSTPARHVRRRVPDATAAIGAETWNRAKLLTTWERPLRLLVAAHVILAVGLLLVHAAG